MFETYLRHVFVLNLPTKSSWKFTSISILENTFFRRRKTWNYGRKCPRIRTFFYFRFSTPQNEQPKISI